MENKAFNKPDAYLDAKARGYKDEDPTEIFILSNLKKIRNGKVLDLGCGNGELLKKIEALGFEVYGLELSKNMVENAKQLGLKNVLEGDIKHLNTYFPQKDFDYVISRFAHFLADTISLDDLYSLIIQKLKLGGYFLGAMPNISLMVDRETDSRDKVEYSIFNKKIQGIKAIFYTLEDHQRALLNNFTNNDIQIDFVEEGNLDLTSKEWERANELKQSDTVLIKAKK